MQDPPGLFLGEQVHRFALPVGQGLQRAQRQRSVDRHHHEGGEQRVPPEQGHEPGRPGGDDHAVGMLRVNDA